MMCFYPVELRNILIITSFEAIKNPHWALIVPTHQRKLSVTNLYFSHSLQKHTHSHRYIVKDRHVMTLTHTSFLSLQPVCPGECRWLTGSNVSHWQTATLSAIIKTTNTDLRFTLHFVTGVICHNPSTSLPHAFIGGARGQIRLAATLSPLGQLDLLVTISVHSQNTLILQ